MSDEKRKRLLQRIANLLLLLCLLLIGGWIAFDRIAARRLKEATARFAELGMSLDPAALAPPAIPDDRNAALVYRKAFDAIDADRVDQLPDSVRERSVQLLWSDDEIRAWHAVAAKHDVAFRELRRARDLPECGFPYDPAMPHLFRAWRALALLSYRLRYETLYGSPGEATECLLDALALARRLTEDPLCAFNGLIRFSATLRDLQELLRTGRWDAGAHSAIAEALARVSPHLSFRRWLRTTLAERAHIISQVQEELGDGGPDVLRPLARFAVRPWIRADLAAFAERATFLVTAFDQPLAKGDPLIRSYERPLVEEPFALGLARLTLPSPKQPEEWWRIVATVELRRRTALAALEIEEHRRTTGRLPESLRNTPVDPLTAEPIEYDIDKGELRASGQRWLLRGD